MALNSKQTLSRLSIESRQSNTTTFLWTSFKTPVSSCCSPCLFFKLHFHHTLSFFKNTRPHVYIHVRQMLHCTPLEFFLFKVPLEKFLLYINITKKKKTFFFYDAKAYDVKLYNYSLQGFKCTKIYVISYSSIAPGWKSAWNIEMPGILKTI